jgi:hypothetical protein
MSPTIRREGPYRFYFNSNEEPRMHIHVEGHGGKAKFWLEPLLSLADFRGMKRHELSEIQGIIERYREEFENAWHEHFRTGADYEHRE